MKKLQVHKSGNFKIMQVSDAQDMHFVRHAMPYMLNRAYDREKPDLVVFTGDNILGNHLCDRRFGSGRKDLTPQQEYMRMEKALSYILRPLEERSIPFTMIFGNHDDMNQLTKEQQLAVFRGYSCFVEGNGIVTGNREVPIYDASGEKRAYTLWLLDSARQDKSTRRCEESILPETIDWLCAEMQKIRMENDGDPIPSLVFVHIPLPVTMQLLQEDENGVIASDGKKYGLDPSCCHGVLNEIPSVLPDDSGLFEILKKDGGVKALVYGHDHPNNFIGEIDGIDIVQTSCASFRCYGNKKLRGVRVFDLDIGSQKTYGTRFLSYEDLCGNGPISNLRYFYNADEYEKKKAIAAAGTVGSAVLAAGAIVYKCLTGRKRQ